MQLTRHTDYALRVLMYLARHPEQLSSVSEVASYYSVSRNHLVKVVQGLTEHGFVETARGKHGGMQLACKPSEISVGDVVRKMESHFNIVDCLDESGTCCIESSCGLKAVIQRATGSFLKELDDASLADVL